MTQDTSDNKQVNTSNLSSLANVADDRPISYCSNCSTALTGLYCHSCGQSSRNMIKFIGEIFREVLEDVVGYDSRLKHTLIPLLFKPGEITLDYIRGRRSYYVLPLRLYLITSLLFILLIKLNAEPNLNFGGSEQSQQLLTEVNAELGDVLQKDKEPTKNIPAKPLVVEAPVLQNAIENVDKVIEQTQKVAATKLPEQEDEDDFSIHFDGADDLEDGFLKDFLHEIQRKWQGWREDPKPLMKQIIELLPYMMFVLLPVFALFLKLFYGFSKRYYVEHLILLLHNHSFLYVALMLEIGLTYFVEHSQSVSDGAMSLTATFAGWMSTILIWWMVIYILWSMRRVYRQSWTITLLKGGALAFIYSMLISFGFVTTILVGVYLA